MSSEQKLIESQVEKKKSKKMKKEKEQVEVDNTDLKKKEKKHKKVKSTEGEESKKKKRKKSKREPDNSSDSESSKRKKAKKAKKEKVEISEVVQEILPTKKEEIIDLKTIPETSVEDAKSEVEVTVSTTTTTINTTEDLAITETSATDTTTTIETVETKPTPRKKKTADFIADLTEIPGETSEQRLLRLLDDPNEEEENKKKIGRFLAIDCEMVGVGPKGSRSALARVSIVNFYGRVLIDKYVKPTERVTDYRTFVSGIKPNHVRSAPPFAKIQKEVAELINNRVIVGHSIHHDLDALKLEHPQELIRDTSLYHHYRAVVDGHTPGLKRLAKEMFNLDIQGGSHSSVTDAQATMLLFRKWKKTWDRQIKRQNHSLKKAAAKTNHVKEVETK